MLQNLLLFTIFIIPNLVSALPAARLATEFAQPCSVSCERAAVIFVHGITGDSTTWLNSTSRKYFPAMMAADNLIKDSADIYRIDYDGSMTTGPSAKVIADEMTKALDNLISSKKYSKVIFVAHSLGGIMVQNYILNVKIGHGHKALSRIRALITLGTPALGSSLANFAGNISGNEQIRVLRPIEINDFQQLLNSSVARAYEKHEVCLSLNQFAAYEKLPEPVIGIVVSMPSATYQVEDRRIRGFDKSHSGLAKPVDENDPIFRWTTSLVKRCIQDDQDICPPQPVVASLCESGDFK